MFIFKRKKPVFEELKKPVYKKNSEKSTYTIICPYCGAELREVYFMKLTSIEITSCEKCGKHFA